MNKYQTGTVIFPNGHNLNGARVYISTDTVWMAILDKFKLNNLIIIDSYCNNIYVGT